MSVGRPLVHLRVLFCGAGNPLSIIGYCNLMVDRNLGEAVLTTPTEPTATTNPSYPVIATGASLSDGEAQTPAIGTNADTVTELSEVEGVAAATVAAVLEAAVDGMARILENGAGQGQGVREDAVGDCQTRHETAKKAPHTTVFRCGSERHARPTNKNSILLIVAGVVHYTLSVRCPYPTASPLLYLSQATGLAQVSRSFLIGVQDL